MLRPPNVFKNNRADSAGRYFQGVQQPRYRLLPAEHKIKNIHVPDSP